MSDDTTRVNTREAFLILNRDFQQLSQRVTEWISDHDRRLTRGGERFAMIDLQQQRTDAEFTGLRVDYSRAMAEIERLKTRADNSDREIGVTLRLANKVQVENAALKAELVGQRRISGMLLAAFIVLVLLLFGGVL